LDGPGAKIKKTTTFHRGSFCGRREAIWEKMIKIVARGSRRRLSVETEKEKPETKEKTRASRLRI